MTGNQIENDGVLTLDELELENKNISSLSENRYLIQIDTQENSEIDHKEEERSLSEGEMSRLGHTQMVATDSDTQLKSSLDSNSQIHTSHNPRVQSDLGKCPEIHGVDITLKHNGEIDHYFTASNDVREVFFNFITWYTSELDDGMTTEEVLQTMMAVSDIEI